MAHATLSPSGAHRWAVCPASLLEESHYPNTGSDYADEGTAAHELAAWALTQEEAHGDAGYFMGKEIFVNGKIFTIDREMVEHVNKYTAAVLAMAQGHHLLVEQRVEFSEYVGYPDSFGTSDAIVLTKDEIQVHDLKYGRGVRVDADDNYQLRLYALGAYYEHSLVRDFKTVRMVIHQPRLNHISESVMTVDELLEFGLKMRVAASKALRPFAVEKNTPEDYVPGEKQCKFCRHKANCEALSKHNIALITDSFGDVNHLSDEAFESAHERVKQCDNEHLASLMPHLDLIEDWCKAVRARVESELLQGNAVRGFKLVEGRKGIRSWSDSEQVKELFKSMRLRDEQMYDFKLISPTTAEKLFKSEVIGPRQWSKVQTFIEQPKGKPSVAPESDKRPAINVQVTAEDFDVVS